MCCSFFLQGVLVSTENTLLYQLFGRGTVLNALLQAVGTHVALELLLVALQGGRSSGVGQDVSLDEALTIRAMCKALLEVVRRTLALELQRLCLQRPVQQAVSFVSSRCCSNIRRKADAGGARHTVQC